MKTPVDIFPNIKIPIVSVIWTYNGMLPQDMSDRITGSFERAALVKVIPANKIISIVNNIGLPVSGINLSYSNSAPATAADSGILITLNESHHPTAARGTYGKQVEAQRSLVEATRASLDLSEQRFKGGIDSYLPVLDAERSLYSAQQTLLTLKQAQLGQEATLYKALGGGSTERTAVKEAS